MFHNQNKRQDVRMDFFHDVSPLAIRRDLAIGRSRRESVLGAARQSTVRFQDLRFDGSDSARVPACYYRRQPPIPTYLEHGVRLLCPEVDLGVGV